MKIPRVITADERFSLRGKRALVYGAACGIGRAVAHEFVSAGAEVIGVDLDEAGLTETANQAPTALSTHVADVTDDNEVRSLTGEFFDADRPCDILFYSVATRYRGESVVDMTPADWRNQIDVNLNGAFIAVHNAIPTMTRGGSIILVASQLGSLRQQGSTHPVRQSPGCRSHG